MDWHHGIPIEWSLLTAVVTAGIWFVVEEADMFKMLKPLIGKVGMGIMANEGWVW
jgi:hypothetical protein